MAAFNTLGYTADDSNPLYTVGVNVRTVVADITITSAAAAGDIHTLVRGLPVDAQILALRLPRGSAQVAGLTDADFGFYRADTGVVIDKDILADGVDFATATKADGVDVLGENLTFDGTKKIKDLLSLESDTEPSGGVNLCMTSNSDASGTGTLSVYIDIAFPA